jgi:hypothetical protein
MQDFSPTTLNLENHYLKFTLEGRAEPIVYRVSKETSERVAKCFDAMDDFALTGAVEFDILSGRMVNVCPRYVVMCHALWDHGPLAPEEEEDNDLILYVLGVAEPETSWDADLEELVEISSVLQHAAQDMSPFVSYTDQDGEVLYVRSDKIMLMESTDYSPFLEEEIAEYEAEAKEAEERKAEAKRKRREKKASKSAPAPADGL